MNAENMELMKAELVALAKRKRWTDDEDAGTYEQAGGNFDDAYSGGADDGETTLAQELLGKYFGLVAPY